MGEFSFLAIFKEALYNWVYLLCFSKSLMLMKAVFYNKKYSKEVDL